ncbi:hypothetical protein M569_00375, partial [Genlisea aurea]
AASQTPFEITSPFQSGMAIAALLILVALFFLGFFSVYIRRLSPSGDISKTGIDKSAVESLPTVPFGGGTTGDCSICLSEFQEGEKVKLIPYCGHVFHPICIDTWLSAHVTCPLCRSSKLFIKRRNEEVCLDVTRPYGPSHAPTESTAETSSGMRRICSLSEMDHRTVLRR